MVIPFIALALVACSPKPSPPPVPQTPPAPTEAPAEAPPADAPGPERFDPAIPKLAPDRAEADVWGCETADDCAVTFYVDGSCCDELCSSTSAYRESFIDALRLQREAECDNAVCLVAGCMESDVEHTAVCEEGRCTYGAVSATAE